MLSQYALYGPLLRIACPLASSLPLEVGLKTANCSPTSQFGTFPALLNSLELQSAVSLSEIAVQLLKANF